MLNPSGLVVNRSLFARVRGDTGGLVNQLHYAEVWCAPPSPRIDDALARPGSPALTRRRRESRRLDQLGKMRKKRQQSGLSISDTSIVCHLLLVAVGPATEPQW